MRKDELMHLHVLVSEAYDYLSKHDEFDESSYSRHKELDVTPVTVHAAKASHKQGVEAVAADIIEAGVDGDRIEPPQRSDLLNA